MRSGLPLNATRVAVGAIPLGPLEDLHDREVAVGLEDQSVPGFPGLGPDRRELIPAHSAYAAHDEERTAKLGYRGVLTLRQEAAPR